MKVRFTTHDEAFTGLEAAIVLIAFIVVAAVFAYVVLGAGFFTTQKTQETVYKGVEQASSNIQMVGQVYGISSVSGQINRIQFNIALGPGAPSMDLSKMIIVVSHPGTSAIAQLSYSSALTDTTFTVTDPATQAALPLISGQKQGAVQVHLPDPLPKDTKLTVEIRPPVGAALPFTRTAPSAIESSQTLH
jgi:archaeal flagellin FlaB